MNELSTPTTTSSPARAPAAAPALPDLEEIKAKQRAAWGAGDYAVVGTTLQIVGETLCEEADVSAGEKVLDVACGNGNAALAAARRHAIVTGVDYVPALLEESNAARNGTLAVPSAYLEAVMVRG